MSDMECHIGPLVSTSDGIASVNTSFSATPSDSILVSPSREGLLLMDTMSNKDDNCSSSRYIVLNTECNKEGRSSGKVNRMKHMNLSAFLFTIPKKRKH